MMTESVWDILRIDSPITMPLENYPDICSYFLEKPLP